MVDFTGCSPQLLNDVVFLENIMVEAAREANATVVNSTFHHFSPIGVSGVVVIEESHLAIHTWPEYGLASVDVFTCGDRMDPMVAANRLKLALLAQQMLKHEYPRAHTGKIVPSSLAKQTDHSPTIVQRAVWFTERLDDMAFSVRHEGGLLFRQQTDFQRIEIFETEGFGRMLVLDGIISLTEHDEWMYHEMLVHIPLLSTFPIKKVLLLGGGDGGALTQLLKHPGIEEVMVIERDPMIREVSQRFFPHLAKDFESPKVGWCYCDAREMMTELPEKRYDLILLDIADFLHPNALICNEEFLMKLKGLLRPKGSMVMPIGIPRVNHQNKAAIQLRKLFSKNQTHFFWAHIPTFPLGVCTFAWCQLQESDPQNTDRDRQHELLRSGNLEYYTPAIHHAALSLPKFMKNLLGEG